ncbi:MAG TPA: protein translocase subunit SecF [Vicinamibacteria bacterium]|nr:protein translocase subunit SecF [Vicinamibacteria bacterium]
MNILPDTRIDWLKYRFHFIALSCATLAACGFLVYRQGGIRYGIDFSEGTIVYAKFHEAPRIEDVRSAIAGIGIADAIIQRYDREELNQILIRVGPQHGGTEELDETANRIIGVLRGLPQHRLIDTSTEIVGPVVGEELRKKAQTAVVVAMAAMLAYIAFRFEPIYGVGATVALIHDVLVTLGFLAVVGYEISLNVIAAFLTLVGYSVNDTIVIFDRVRENRRVMRMTSLHDIINLSINQTLRRTILTSLLTFLAVLPLFLLGGAALRPFAFVMLVGIVTGTYSTLGIASPIVLWWKQARRQRAQSASGRPKPVLPRL